MRYLHILVSLASLVAANCPPTAGTGAALAARGQQQAQNGSDEERLTAAINDARASNGLPTLSEDPA